MSGLRKRKQDFTDLFNDEDEYMTDGEKLDAQLRAEDSSNDGSIYNAESLESESSSEIESPPIPKKPKKFPAFVPPPTRKPVPTMSSSKKDEVELSSVETFESVEEITRRLAAKNRDETNKENVAPKTNDDEDLPDIPRDDGTFKMLNPTTLNKMETHLKRKGGKYNSGLLVKILEKIANVIEEKKLSYQKLL